MFDVVDTPFSYGRVLIICSSLQEFSKTKEGILHVIWNGDTAFLFCGADMELKLHTQQDKSYIYYVWKHYVVVCDYSENIDNLLAYFFFLRHPVYHVV